MLGPNRLTMSLCLAAVYSDARPNNWPAQQDETMSETLSSVCIFITEEQGHLIKWSVCIQPRECLA